MPRLPMHDFREAPNPDVLNAIRNNASRDYRERIPEATQANIQETVAELHRYRGLRNEFVDALVDRIGLEVFRGTVWNNPLQVFKKGMLEFGRTVEEVQTGLITATVHDWDRDSLEKDVFGQAKLDVQTSFHTINRELKYKITVNEIALRRAFLTENGLGSFVHNMMSVPATSNQFDEFLTMANLLVENYDNGGFFKVNVPAIEGGDQNTARNLLRELRAWADTVSFISTKYNASGMPVAADRDKLVVITTPEVKASLDVDALSAAFNIERADVPYRIVSIPAEHWPIPGAQAVLTTEDFFQVWDTLFENRAIQNPDGLYENRWAHHHGIFSLSRFVPAILFTTEPGDVITVTDPTISSVTTPTAVNAMREPVTEFERGYYFQILSNAVSDVEGVGEAVDLDISEHTSDMTRIENTGTLLIGVDEEAESLTVTSTSVSDPSKSASATFPITGEIARRWPDPGVVDPETTDPGE